MKTLVEYIKEACEEGKCASSKSLSFNFADCEGTEDFLKSVKETAEKDGVDVEVEDNKVKVSLKKDSVDDAEGLFELIQDFVHLRGKDQKRASDEAYAQKIVKLEKTLDDWREFVDDTKVSVEGEDDKKEKENKKDDKKEEE